MHTDIWGNDDWLDLTVDAQNLYMMLYTSPALSLCGAADWHVGRLCNRAADWTPAKIERAAEELSERLFLIIDTETDECLLRSWVKHDGLWRTPNMAVSVTNARADLASRTLRGVIVHEVRKLRDAEPESTSWEKDAVKGMLRQNAVDPEELPPFKGASNPGSKGASNPYVNPGSKGGLEEDLRDGVKGASNGGPTTSTSITTTSTKSSSARARREPHPIPDSWQPTDMHRAKVGSTVKAGVDVDFEAEQFRNHAIANDRRQANWDASFATWLGRSEPRKQDARRAPDGRELTKRERQFLDLELKKDNPNPAVLAQFGMTPNNHLRAVQGGTA
ncbi:hypothetical protein [Williamsia phyllosphaerae]|nr:hypothetical protein [Williamsia phyllosphaerae]